MKTTTQSGRSFDATPNYSKLTYTIRTNGLKYRTIPMCRAEFNDRLSSSAADWSEFLRRNDGRYYVVK